MSVLVAPTLVSRLMWKVHKSVEAKVAQGTQHKTTNRCAVILKDEARYFQLVNAVGDQTKLGNYYEKKSGVNVPMGRFDT